ncbi:MAG: 50S ribosomal protein L22 [Nanoarchaeota archaeon]|nr:50S ribosomal protein L22 [Nanoarchaeota archaeon]
MVNYSFNSFGEDMARAYGRDLSISTKKSVEICKAIRGKSVENAKIYLQNVADIKAAVPMTKFHRDCAHRTGIGPGRYPVKAAEGILLILESAEQNAKSKGFSTKDLFIIHVCAHKASSPWHMGRQRRRHMKRTHIEIVVQEKKTGKVVKND